MAPLLSGDELLHTDAKEAAYDPFSRAVTEDIIDLVSAALNNIGIGNKKKGKKTTLIRDTAIALAKYLGGEPPAADAGDAALLLLLVVGILLFACSH